MSYAKPVQVAHTHHVHLLGSIAFVTPRGHAHWNTNVTLTAASIISASNNVLSGDIASLPRFSCSHVTTTTGEQFYESTGNAYLGPFRALSELHLGTESAIQRTLVQSAQVPWLGAASLDACGHGAVLKSEHRGRCFAWSNLKSITFMKLFKS